MPGAIDRCRLEPTGEHVQCVRFSLRSGFALSEVLVAAFVFAVGVLALEATAASALRRMRRSSDLALAASMAQSRLETLAASRCDDVASGSDTVRGIVSSWIVEPAQEPFVRGVTQTLTYTLDGAARTDVYGAMIPCAP